MHQRYLVTMATVVADRAISDIKKQLQLVGLVSDRRKTRPTVDKHRPPPHKPTGTLLSFAHTISTPPDINAIVHKLMELDYSNVLSWLHEYIINEANDRKNDGMCTNVVTVTCTCG